MSQKWHNVIKEVASDTRDSFKTELINLVDIFRNDSNSFLREQGERLNEYLEAYANGEITKERFEADIREMEEIVRLEILFLKSDAKQRALYLMDNISGLIYIRLLGRK